MTGELEAAEARLTMLASRAATTVEQATVACLRIDLYMTLDRSDRAVEVALTYLRHLGVEWSPHPTEEEARREYQRTWALLGSREIEELIDLPVMSDPVSLATLDVLTKLALPALYAGYDNLYCLAICRAVNLSLQHGNTDASCFGYVTLGSVVAGPRFGDYASALVYLSAGAALLRDEAWERRHELVFALELHRAECEFLTGELAAAEARLTTLASRAATTVEQATVACLRIDLYITLDRSDRAVDVGLTYLRHVGVDWPAHPTEAEARREYERTWALLGSREIEELIDLPVMSDPVSLATLEVLTKVATPALYAGYDNLFSLTASRAVNLSLEHGNTDASCHGYVAMAAAVAGPRFGDYSAGFRFGRLARDLVDQRGLQRFKARTYVVFGNLVMPWTKHVRTGRDLVRRAFDVANAIGDLTFAALSSNNLITNLLAAGDPLADVQREAEQGLEFAEKGRFGFVVDRFAVQLGLIRTLRGLTPIFGCFNDERFDELQFERHLSSNPMLALPECWYWIRKLQARFFAGDYVAAVEASVAAQRLLFTSPSYFETAEAHFYGALSHAAACDAALPAQYQQHAQALSAHHRQLLAWAEHGPENFANRAALVGAEIARLEGRALDAERLYEEAIRSARENGFVHNEALANELASRFYAARGFETIAHAYLLNARNGYLRWGADGKVRQLDDKYPHLVDAETAPAPTGTIAAPLAHLDLATVLKVSQAVSGEIVLEKLIDTLLRTAIEQAGAERGLLILSRGDELSIAAEANTSGDTVTVHVRE
ncbi:MAG TPA: hypothetical protein VLJ12_13660, partial [Burkholderiales bacterium]|nr:hypothetical protein [Burkholderiales bacterium]